MKTPPKQQDVTPTAAGKLLTSRNSFTIIELVVVLTIIALLMTIVLPGISDMWEQRKIASAHNTLIGAINLAKQNAGGKGESGLFFALDEGVQKIYPIEHAEAPNNPPGDSEALFRVVDGKVITLPKPMRAAPLSVFKRPKAGDTGDDLEFPIWSAFEINNDEYRLVDLINMKGPQRHRNFFTMIFLPPAGRLSVEQNVMIQDPDKPITSAGGPDNKGDHTGLEVADAVQMKHYAGTTDTITHFTNSIPDMVVDLDSVPKNAINFKSVNGVVLYNEDVLQMQGNGTLQLKYMRERTRPLFVHPITGTIARVDPESP